ncbi:MAG: hypothetical protein ABIC04_02240 [Nanoarchaeota archaeon]
MKLKRCYILVGLLLLAGNGWAECTASSTIRDKLNTPRFQKILKEKGISIINEGNDVLVVTSINGPLKYEGCQLTLYNGRAPTPDQTLIYDAYLQNISTWGDGHGAVSLARPVHQIRQMVCDSIRKINLYRQVPAYRAKLRELHIVITDKGNLLVVYKSGNTYQYDRNCVAVLVNGKKPAKAELREADILLKYLVLIREEIVRPCEVPKTLEQADRNIQHALTILEAITK